MKHETIQNAAVHSLYLSQLLANSKKKKKNQIERNERRDRFNAVCAITRSERPQKKNLNESLHSLPLLCRCIMNTEAVWYIYSLDFAINNSTSWLRERAISGTLLSQQDRTLTRPLLDFEGPWRQNKRSVHSKTATLRMTIVQQISAQT